jgi:hypothetical protein
MGGWAMGHGAMELGSNAHAACHRDVHKSAPNTSKLDAELAIKWYDLNINSTPKNDLVSMRLFVEIFSY